MKIPKLTNKDRDALSRLVASEDFSALKKVVSLLQYQWKQQIFIGNLDAKNESFRRGAAMGLMALINSIENYKRNILEEESKVEEILSKIYG